MRKLPSPDTPPYSWAQNLGCRRTNGMAAVRSGRARSLKEKSDGNPYVFLFSQLNNERALRWESEERQPRNRQRPGEKGAGNPRWADGQGPRAPRCHSNEGTQHRCAFSPAVFRHLGAARTGNDRFDLRIVEREGRTSYRAWGPGGRGLSGVLRGESRRDCSATRQPRGVSACSDQGVCRRR